MQRMTVSELAKRITPGAPDKTREGVLRQLRHWTATHVLPGSNETEIHRGTGRHRTYSSADMYFAALALELAKFKLPVGPLKWILWTIHSNINSKNGSERDVLLWQAAIDDKYSVYLVVQAAGVVDEMDFALSLQTEGSSLQKLLKPSHVYNGVGVILIVDLSGIFRRLHS